jgi:phospholipase A1
MQKRIKMKRNLLLLVITVAALCSGKSAAQTLSKDAIQACMAEELKTATDDTTIGELREKCSVGLGDPIKRRVALENSASSNPFAILPHRPNYLLPVTFSEPREEPYADVLQGRSFDNFEAKFQLSLKYIAAKDIFFDNLDLNIAFTATSYWQAYNGEISAPFRETNYEPEVIFNYNEPFRLFGLEIDNSYLSLNHQSNGQAGTLSRSWNRIIGAVAFNTKDVTWSVKTWYRIPEDERESGEDIGGDDNPNIERYYGYGELGALWQINDSHNLDILLRNNLRSDNRGAIRVGWSFPFSKNLRGYVEYFNGYGESLIYFDQHVERLGVGFKLTDWL